jgi:UDP-galactopyranose mutase
MIVVVGAGLSGAVIAERFANQLGEQVLVLEKRSHSGGNCYDYTCPEGLLIPMYGPHFFHTKDERIRDYVKRFADWQPYEHRVLSFVDGKHVPVPVNLSTVNLLFGLSLDETEMKQWLDNNVVSIKEPLNAEEAALSRVGPVLYEKMFKNYTAKQWDADPRDLDPEVMRIPVRTSADDLYFDDPFQAIPKKGYTSFVERLLANQNIEVRLNTDYFEISNHLPQARMTFFTGRIDQFFRQSLGMLDYRSLRFELETWEFEEDNPGEFILPATTVNYPNAEKFTRLTEPKRATGQKSPVSILIREYPTWVGEPYYPVLNKKNRKLYEAYQSEAKKLERDGIYFNMDEAIRNSLDLFDRVTR